VAAKQIDDRAFGPRYDLAAFLLALICALPAVVAGARAVQGITQPYDFDQFRDAASAQSIADGDFPDDPFYRGEQVWYNPLLPATVAAISRAAGAGAARTLVQAGPYLNAFGPIMLFVMTRALFGPWPALLALVSLLYAPPHGDPAWSTPSYSPWLFASNFASGFFYLGIWALHRATSRATKVAWAMAGLVLGLTFLAHTAPALILAGCALPEIRRRGGESQLVGVAILFGVAFVVSAPFLASILGHYHLRIENRAPAEWTWAPIASVTVALHGSLSFKNLPGFAGLTLLALRRSADAGWVRRWVLGSLAGFGYAALLRFPAAGWLPPLVPQFHFYFYLRAAGHVAAGVAVWTAIASLVAIARRGRPQVCHAAAVAAACLAVAFSRLSFEAFHQRPAFAGDRLVARRLTVAQDDTAVVDRLRRETPPNAVVLASPDLSLMQVGQADRAVVAVPREFSNPFVAYEPRAVDERALMSALILPDHQSFRRLTVRRGVTHVLLAPSEAALVDVAGANRDDVAVISTRAGYVLYAVR
jgi:hypothetical protein